MAEVSTKKAWLDGPGDLKEAVVEDVPAPGQSVRVRGLAAAYSNQASSEALEMITGEHGRQSAKVNTERLSVLQFAHGVIEPKFSVAEAELISQKYGPAFNKVVAKIDELSGLDKDAIEETNARFRASDAGEEREVGSGAAGGSAEPDVATRPGA